jgi:hypothetical protein
MRRIAVVDMDGVVNYETWLQDIAAGRAQRPTVRFSAGDEQVLVDPAKVGILNMLARPGVEWVLSSTWRGDGGDQARARVQAILEQLGWRGTLIGSTPILRTYAKNPRTNLWHASQASRGDEIAAWLETNSIAREQIGKDVRIAIIDDTDDIEPLRAHWVAVDEKVGITVENALRALTLLDEIVITVDELVPRPSAKLKIFRAGSCHLTVNGYSEKHLDALHKFAARIGLKRRWYQPHKLAPHYDLTIGKRARAVAAGAAEVSTRALLEEMRRLRAT